MLVVIAVHKQMRTITNFFLANLAVADLCVGVVCVLPNMSTYVLSPYWRLGRVCEPHSTVIHIGLYSVLRYIVMLNAKCHILLELRIYRLF